VVSAPNPRTWVNGEFVDDTKLNSINGLRDAMRFMLDPPSVILRQTVSQSLPNNAYTALTFTTEDYDNEATASYLSGVGMHDPAVNPSRMTCQTAGRYLLTGGCSFVSGTGRRGLQWTVNGVSVPATQIIFAAGSTSGQDMPCRVTIVSLSVGDYVELRAFQDSGAAMSLGVPSPGGSNATARWIGL
jgi:hypothetical protein